MTEPTPHGKTTAASFDSRLDAAIEPAPTTAWERAGVAGDSAGCTSFVHLELEPAVREILQPRAAGATVAG